MLTTFYTIGTVDETPPFHAGTRPDPTNGYYYRAKTTYWYITPDSSLTTDSPQVDLEHVCKAGDIITMDNKYKSLWFYKEDTKELFIPLANAQLIVLELYKIMVPLDAAQAWLRTLEFSKRFSRADTCSLYAGVKFDDCAPHATKNARCVVLDLSKNDESDVTDEEWDAMKLRAEQGDKQYAKPYEWRKRREVMAQAKAEGRMQYLTQLERLTQGNSNVSKLVTKRTRAAKMAHSLRMAKKYGRDTPEYRDAMTAYDNGVRGARGRKGDDENLRQNTQIKVARYVHNLANPEINLFYGDLVGARRSGDIRVSDAPIIHPSSLLAPTRFHTDWAQAPYDVANRPIAWAIETREVRVPVGESTFNEYHEVRTQVTKVAIVESKLSLEMANYSQALHFVGVRKERNPVTHHMETVAVFDIDHIASGKLRARRPSDKPSTQAQLDALTQRVEEQAEKIAKLGKAFHALMGVIKTLEERLSP